MKKKKKTHSLLSSSSPYLSRTQSWACQIYAVCILKYRYCFASLMNTMPCTVQRPFLPKHALSFPHLYRFEHMYESDISLKAMYTSHTSGMNPFFARLRVFSAYMRTYKYIFFIFICSHIIKRGSNLLLCSCFFFSEFRRRRSAAKNLQKSKKTRQKKIFISTLSKYKCEAKEERKMYVCDVLHESLSQFS